VLTPHKKDLSRFPWHIDIYMKPTRVLIGILGLLLGASALYMLSIGFFYRIPARSLTVTRM